MGDAEFLHGRRVAFLGKLGSMNRREAHRLLRRFNAIPSTPETAHVDLLILGADAWPLEAESLLSESQKQAARQGRLEIISETDFWERLGLLDPEVAARRLYTPAMVAQLLNVPVRLIRGWARRGWIRPVQELHRLPYFDFQEVVTARKLVQLLAAGVSESELQTRLQQLAEWLPGIDRPLAQLSIISQGRSLLTRSARGLIDHRGQRHFDFVQLPAMEMPGTHDASTGEPACDQEPDAEDREKNNDLESARLYPLPWARVSAEDSWENYVSKAQELEEDGLLAAAMAAYRCALLAGGLRSEIHFALAELLYRAGDLSAARERYLCALELEPDFVEARSSLACVLFEEGSVELAVAAMEGALQYHPEFPDAHYNLARFLDHLQRPAEAEHHWREFLRLSPEARGLTRPGNDWGYSRIENLSQKHPSLALRASV